MLLSPQPDVPGGRRLCSNFYRPIGLGRGDTFTSKLDSKSHRFKAVMCIGRQEALSKFLSPSKHLAVAIHLRSNLVRYSRRFASQFCKSDAVTVLAIAEQGKYSHSSNQFPINQVSHSLRPHQLPTNLNPLYGL